MLLELKKAIIEWLIDNPNAWQRVNACHKEFRQYIYDPNGNYIIGGEAVSKFISDANTILYTDGKRFEIEKKI